jgi:general stress protein 26
MKYNEIVDRIVTMLGKTSHATLATADKNGIVSARSMAIVNEGLKVYMQTDRKFDKVKDIKENPNVAISFPCYSFKALAKIIGHPCDNKMFVEKLKAKHLKTYKSYTELPDEILIEIELIEAKIWGFENNNIHENEIITVVDFKNKKVSQIICDKL